MEDLHFNVWDIEQFFECNVSWDKYEGFYYDEPAKYFEEYGDIPYLIASKVCDIFDLELIGHGCSRVVVRFGNYVAKICTEEAEWACANDRELELIKLLEEKDRTDLLEYLVPIVGSVEGKRFSDTLVIVAPLCADLDSNREVLSPDQAIELGKEIHDAFYEAGIDMKDISLACNYGFYKGKWRLLDFAEWSTIDKIDNLDFSSVFSNLFDSDGNLI